MSPQNLTMARSWPHDDDASFALMPAYGTSVTVYRFDPGRDTIDLLGKLGLVNISILPAEDKTEDAIIGVRFGPLIQQTVRLSGVRVEDLSDSNFINAAPASRSAAVPFAPPQMLIR